jgi:hypothetical protein
VLDRVAVQGAAPLCALTTSGWPTRALAADE